MIELATEHDYDEAGDCRHHDSPLATNGDCPVRTVRLEPSDLETFVGIPVTSIGEDGDYLALGHVEPRRMLAAVWLYSRRSLGLEKADVFGDECSPLEKHLEEVRHTRVLFTTGRDHESDWYGSWSPEAQQHSDAQDVTAWSPW